MYRLSPIVTGRSRAFPKVSSHAYASHILLQILGPLHESHSTGLTGISQIICPMILASGHTDPTKLLINIERSIDP